MNYAYEALKMLFGESGIISGGATVDESIVPDVSATPKPGDTTPAASAPAEGQPPVASGDGQVPAEGQGTPPPPAAPKFGEFGDDPSKLFDAFQQLKGKTTATERNMAALNKTLEGMGVKAVKSQDGNFQLVPMNTDSQPKQRERRFKDEFKAHFDDVHLTAIEAKIQDSIEDFLEAREKQSFERQKQVSQWNGLKNEANTLMMDLYPSLDGQFKDGKATNPAFNEAFYNRATEIWQNNYANDPYGELKAAREAAAELKVDFRQTVAAQKAGFEAGAKSRTVVGPVQGGSSVPSGGKGKLTKAEYLKMTAEERQEYDKKQLGG